MDEVTPRANSNTPDKGLRFNTGKTRHDLVPAYAQEQYARVLTKGAEKYAERNWELGMKWSKIIASLKRHTLAIERGEDYDPETGILHSAHIMCNAAFLTEYYKIYPQGDDRPNWYLQGHRVGLDIDDVLSDFCPHFCRRFNLKEPHFWNFDRSIADKFNEIMTDKEFWLSIPIKIGPESIKFEPACYITSRSIPRAWTEEWLDKNGFAAVKVYQVGVDGSKVACAKAAGIDYFIDDRFENFVELNRAGVFTYLYDAPHNQRYNVGHRRIYSINDIVC